MRIGLPIIIFLGYKTEFFFFLPKQSQKSRSILLDGSRSLGLFREDKTSIIAKFHSSDKSFVVILESGEPCLKAKRNTVVDII